MAVSEVALDASEVQGNDPTRKSPIVAPRKSVHRVAAIRDRPVRWPLTINRVVVDVDGLANAIGRDVRGAVHQFHAIDGFRTRSVGIRQDVVVNPLLIGAGPHHEVAGQRGIVEDQVCSDTVVLVRCEAG